MLSQDMSMPQGIVIVNTHRNPDACESSSMPADMLAKRRYQLLVQQLSEDTGDDQSQIAEWLHIKQPHVSRLKSGRRKAGIDSIELAVRKFKISPAFFFSPMGTEPHYTRFKGPHKIPPEMGYPALHAFLKLADETSMRVTDEERRALTAQEWDGYPTVQSYMLLLQAFRALEVPEVTEVKARPAPKQETATKGKPKPKKR